MFRDAIDFIKGAVFIVFNGKIDKSDKDEVIYFNKEELGNEFLIRGPFGLFLSFFIISISVLGLDVWGYLLGWQNNGFFMGLFFDDILKTELLYVYIIINIISPMRLIAISTLLCSLIISPVIVMLAIIGSIDISSESETNTKVSLPKQFIRRVSKKGDERPIEHDRGR